MNTKIVKRCTGALTCMGVAGLITMSLFAPAQAESFVATTRVTVRFSDLDLSKPAGIEELYRRIGKAAGKACGGYPSGNVMWEKNDYRQCRDIAIARAVQDVNNGQLTAMHKGGKGKAGSLG